MHYRFDDFELDQSTFSLSRNGEAVHVEPLVFDLVHYFVTNAGQVVSRDALMESVWKNRIVSDATLSGTIKEARKALGDSGEKQRYIKTIRGRGFRFLAEVTQGKPKPPKSTSNANNPSLIILPFAVFNDAGSETLADSFAENLTTILTRIPLLQIVSRAASLNYKGKAVNAEELRQQLGVDFMLEGSLQRSNNDVRINVQLIDTLNGYHLWAQSFDQADGGEVLSQLLNGLVAKLEPQLVRAILQKLNSQDEELNSRQLMLQAMSVVATKGWHRDSFDEAASILRRVIKMEPDLALARAYLSLILGLGFRVGLQDRSEDIMNEAAKHAELALKLDNMDSIVVGLAGCALADIGQPQRAIPLLEKAIDLNPNNGHAYAALGSAQAILQKFDDAIGNLRKGIDISPADNRRSVWCAVLAMTQLFCGQSDEAVKTSMEGIRYDDGNYFPWLTLAAAYYTRGERQQAAQAMADCYRVKPDLSAAEIEGLTGARLAADLGKLYRQ